MKSNVGDFYILQDGTQAAPGDCSEGKDGVMRHENGLMVLMDSEGNPLTVQKQAEEGGAAKAAEMGRDAAEAVESAAPQVVEEKPADENPAHGAMVQAMMPERAAKSEAKAEKPKGE